MGRARLALVRLEGNPATQYRFHKLMARLWAMITLPLLYLVLFQPGTWLKYGVGYVMVASNYANWATDSGVMAAANASTEDSITAFDQLETGDHDQVL